MANSADPNQLASSEANWSGSTLFAKQGISGFSRTRVNNNSRVGLEYIETMACIVKFVYLSILYSAIVFDFISNKIL